MHSTLFRIRRSFLVLFLFFMALVGSASAQEAEVKPKEKPTAQAVIDKGIERLIELQQPKDGMWPYEGVYRVRREIPIGYRIGGTAICCTALLHGADPDNEAANEAILLGTMAIVGALDHPLMIPSQRDTYDVRVWGHIFALDWLCRLQASKRFPKYKIECMRWIPKLTEYLVSEELPSGGWNYANRRAHASFVTAPAVQALLLAREAGVEIDEAVFQRALDALLRSRSTNGAFTYSGNGTVRRPTAAPGSIARTVSSEIAIELISGGRGNAIQNAINDFYEHWDELEKRRKKTGTHKPPYGIAPYYFYYGHRYVGQGIQYLPEKRQAAERERILETLLKTRDDDGTWNDRVFDRSKAYGTAMSVMALLGDKVPMPDTRTLKLDNDGEQIGPGPLRLRAEQKDSPDDLVFVMDEDLMILFKKNKIPLDELDDWLSNHPPKRLPTKITLKIAGRAKIRDEALLKKAIRKHIGDCVLVIEVIDDVDQ